MNLVSIHPKSDSWLLYSILHASKQGPADRNKIVAVADYYNHAVLTIDELEHGLQRLTEEGWIIKESFTYSAAPKATEAYARILREKLNCFEEMNRLQDNLEG